MNKNVKAGIWYTASNFLSKGIAFLSMPVFTRILTKEEFGDFNNFMSWGTLLVVITSIDLYSSINRAYFDYRDDFEEYMSSISALSIFFTSICYLIVFLFRGTVTDILNMDFKYINILFLYLFFYPAYNFFMTQQRISGRYILFVMTSIGSSLVSLIVSILLVMKMEDKLLGRVLGYVLPMVMINAVIYGVFFYRGKRLVREKAKYALVISAPLIPHHLSSNILNSSDRVMIKEFCGAGDTALYSLAYSLSMIVTLLHTSINQAYVPWLYKKLHKNNLSGIKKNSEMIILGFFMLVLGMLLVAPEILLILGGEKYADAIYVIPLVMLGCCFQFIYTLYVNIEFYCKKTITVSIGTVLAATLNIILNYILIPLYGYSAASLTTLIGYVALYAIHYVATRKMEYGDIYNNKNIFFITLVFSVISCGMYVIYPYSKLRVAILAVYGIACSLGGVKMYKSLNKCKGK